MGYMRHHAIVVTSYNGERLEFARDVALELGCQVSEMVEGAINGYYSFMVAPDGSKEGWDDSNIGDERRSDFLEWLDGERHRDNSSPYDWIEVEFGGDGEGAEIVSCGNG